MSQRFRISRRVLLAIAALTFLSACDRIQSAIFDRAAETQAAGDRSDWLEDGGLHVVLCGTGSPLADPERAGPCTAVIAGGHFFLVDVGPGSWENVQTWRLPRAQLSGVLLTHFHSDHIGELGEVVTQSWIAGRQEPLKVYGPPGVQDVVVGFQQAYTHDREYRVAHHGDEAMPPDGGRATAVILPVPPDNGSHLVLEQDGVRVTAFSVDHEPVVPAFGYRIEYNGRSVVISGDTKKSANLIEHAKGADILVHEALAAHLITQMVPRFEKLGQARLAKLAGDVVDYHTTPVQAAEAAKEAGVRQLVLTHLVPPPINAVVRREFMQGVDEAWDGKVVLGEDGMHFTLPKGTTDIVQGEM